jgi:hypothetical protein
LRHIASTTEARLELFQNQEDFAVIPACFLGRFNVNRPNFSAVLPGGQIGTRAIVSVVEPEPGRTWREGDAPPAVRRNERGAFLGGSIDVDRNFLTVPMQLFRCVRILVNFDRYLPPFFETKQRSRKLPILCNRRNDSFGRDFYGRGPDVQRVVRTHLVLRSQANSGKRKLKARPGKFYARKRASASQESAAGNAKGPHT